MQGLVYMALFDLKGVYVMYDVLIIGAGVVGASVARELSRYKLKLAVVESKCDVAMGSTGANSAIIHAGYDCKPGSIMAQMNLLGNKLYDQLHKELDFPFKRIGSLVIAFNDDEVNELKNLYSQGQKNGVKNLEFLNRQETLDKELNINPNVRAALYAPSAGITCPYELTVALIENAIENGVEVFLDNPVIDLQKVNEDTFKVVTSRKELLSRYIINCAGLYADDISKMLGDNDFEITPRKGEYNLYDRVWGNVINTVIFQTPNKMGKGVLVTPTVDGNLLIGPSAVDVSHKDDTRTSIEGLDYVYTKALESISHLPRRGIIRSFSGSRAISNTGDFIISHSKKVEGLFHAAGISSPGLTAAPAIARKMSAILQKKTGYLELKDDFKSTRKAIPRFRELDKQQRSELIKKNPQYGRIVCRCETVTEGQIIDALSRNLPATTIDAIKRRTRAGMGRCQGGFCTPKIMEIMEKQMNIPITHITKMGGCSNIVKGRIKDNLRGGRME